MNVRKLEGRTAIVSGGAQGIGEAHSRILAENGAHVVIADVRADEGEALATKLGNTARFVHLDVTDRTQWDECVQTALEFGEGTVDILVNNAGINRPTPIESMEPETWNRVLATNLSGPFFGIQSVIPAMKRQGGGRIVNTSSITAVVPPTLLAPYVASKQAIVGLTQIAAMELGKYGIYVNALQPGYIDTPMMHGGDEAAITAEQAIPRYGRPEEVAEAMLFLVSDATYTTGSVFPVDGGAVAGANFVLAD